MLRQALEAMLGPLSTDAERLCAGPGCVELETGEPLLRAGDRWQHLWWVERGDLRLYYLDRQGQASTADAWARFERRVLAALLEDKMLRERQFLQCSATERYLDLLARFLPDGELASFEAEEDGDPSTPYHGSGEHVTRQDYRLVEGVRIPWRFTISRRLDGKLHPFWDGQVTRIARRAS